MNKMNLLISIMIGSLFGFIQAEDAVSNYSGFAIIPPSTQIAEAPLNVEKVEPNQGGDSESLSEADIFQTTGINLDNASLKNPDFSQELQDRFSALDDADHLGDEEMREDILEIQ